MAQEEILPRETARVRKVVQISTMVHSEKDWAFIALCGDESLWLYHGSWSRIENRPQTTDLESGLGEQSELNWRDVVTALEAAFTGFAAIARSLIDERYFSRINH